MCLDAGVLPHKLVNMNMNQNSELNFHREIEHVWGPHLSDTMFLKNFNQTVTEKKNICGAFMYRIRYFYISMCGIS